MQIGKRDVFSPAKRLFRYSTAGRGSSSSLPIPTAIPLFHNSAGMQYDVTGVRSDESYYSCRKSSKEVWIHKDTQRTHFIARCTNNGGEQIHLSRYELCSQHDDHMIGITISRFDNPGINLKSSTSCAGIVMNALKTFIILFFSVDRKRVRIRLSVYCA